MELLENEKSVDAAVLNAVKEFIEDLSLVVSDSVEFQMYKSIVSKIDETKVVAYAKLLRGIKRFFADNEVSLKAGVFRDLANPYIGYASESGTFSFNFEAVYNTLDEAEQEVLRSHLNAIWELVQRACAPTAEEVHVDKIFKAFFSTQEEGKSSPNKEDRLMVLVQKIYEGVNQNLDMKVVIQLLCKKSKVFIHEQTNDPNNSALQLIAEVENIDFANFDAVQMSELIQLVLKTGGEDVLNTVRSTVSKMVGVDLLALMAPSNSVSSPIGVEDPERS